MAVALFLPLGGGEAILAPRQTWHREEAPIRVELMMADLQSAALATWLRGQPKNTLKNYPPRVKPYDLPPTKSR
jgi:hypothetical protein